MKITTGLEKQLYQHLQAMEFAARAILKERSNGGSQTNAEKALTFALHESTDLLSQIQE